MHILIAGGTGFIGRALVKHFTMQGHQISILGRSIKKTEAVFGDNVNSLAWDNFAPKAEDILGGVHWLINLTGANIGECRWSNKRKSSIIESRIGPTNYLAKVCGKLGKQSPVFFNASAIGVYGLKPTETPYSENTAIDFDQADDFLSEVGRTWEKALEPAENAGVRTVKLRFGVVLGSGGVLAKLTPIHKLGLGGPIGSGKQPFCWISINDVIRAIDFIFADKSISGPVNLVAPANDTQKAFAKAFSKALHRPSFIPTPGFVLKAVFGQMAQELLLQGQYVTPSRLQQRGFMFEFPTLDAFFSHHFNAKL